MRLKSHIALLAISSSLFFTAGPSFALDQVDFLNKLNGAFKLNSIELKPGNVLIDGNSIRFEATKIVSKDLSDVDVGTIVFSNVQEAKGGYLIERVDTQPFEFQVKPEGAHFKAQGAQLINYHLPAISDYRTLDNTPYAESGFFNGLRVEQENEPVLTIGKVDFATKRDDADDSYLSTMSTDRFDIHLKNKETSDQNLELLKQLKIETLSGKFDLSGKMIVGIGRMSVDKLDIDLDNLGKFGLNLDLVGYTADFLQELNRLNALAPELDTDDTEKTPEQKEADHKRATEYTMGLFGLSQRLTINSFSLRFDDDSLTEKLLAYGAQKNGMTPDTMKNAVKGMTPLIVSQWQIPSIQTSISSAVNTFLDDPKSFTISAKPTAPVAVPSIIGLISDPDGLVKLLNVTVTAND